jgi:mono/diheme cytochrome c family protein
MMIGTIRLSAFYVQPVAISSRPSGRKNCSYDFFLLLQSVKPAIVAGAAQSSGEFWMRWGLLVAIGSIAFAIAGLYALLLRVDLSAVQQPGRTAEYLRTKLTRAVVRRRATREEIPLGPPDRSTSMSISRGKNLYDADCAGCHGTDGRTPTLVGRGMFPPATALHSPGVQSYSDRELFSLIRQGIRFTGMPAFSGSVTNDQIWDVIDYVRSLR